MTKNLYIIDCIESYSEHQQVKVMVEELREANAVECDSPHCKSGITSAEENW